MKYGKTLTKNQTIMLLIPSEKYNKTIAEVAKDFSKKKVCYITLNKTYESLEPLFKKAKVNTKQFVFVDGITKSIKDIDDEPENCYFISSPGALTELSLVINRFLSLGFDYLIFDSITNLQIYRERSAVEKFVINLVHKVKQTKTKGIFYAVKLQEQEGLIRQTEMFVDNVMEAR